MTEAPSEMTLSEADTLVGDDIAYWMGNPFLTPEMRIEKVLWWLSHVTAPLAADQPPVCPDHREAQHRDNKPPWCDSCGWRHGEPARRYGNGRVVA